MSPRNSIRLFWGVVPSAATPSCVNSSQAATSFIPFHSCAAGVPFLHMNPLDALTTRLNIGEASVQNALGASFGEEHFPSMPENLFSPPLKGVG